MTRTEGVRKYIESIGLPVVSATEPDSEVDGEILVSEQVSVQVGHSYMGVVVKRPGDNGEPVFNFYPPARSAGALARALREAIAAAA